MNPQHNKEEIQNTNSQMTARTQSKATRSLFLSEMFATLEKTLNIVQQNKDQTQNPRKQLGHWLDMVYLLSRGYFVDRIFLEAQCLARILQHVSPLTIAALRCNSLLYTLPDKRFDN